LYGELNIIALIAIKTNMSLRKFSLIAEQKKGKKLVIYPNIDRNL
jgi:hypothetical protein